MIVATVAVTLFWLEVSILQSDRTAEEVADASVPFLAR
jgi:hypothetical protein